MSYESPVRTEIRTEILAALTQASQAMTAAQLADLCPSSPDNNEVARICFELRTKKGLIEFGEDSHAPGKRPVKTYQIMSTDSAEAWAARQAASVIATPKPKKTKKLITTPASASHPWKQAVVPPKAPRAPRVTRPLPTHLHSVAPAPVADNSHLAQWLKLEEPPVAATEVVAIETPVVEPPADIDAALIAALQDAAADLPKSIASPTEEIPMSQDPAIYAPEIALPQPAVGLDREPPAGPDPDTLVLKAVVEPKAAHECQGHCANHAQADDAMWDALRQDDDADRLEEIRLAMVDGLLIYANLTLRDDPVWKAMLRPYAVAAGAALEVCHG